MIKHDDSPNRADNPPSEVQAELARILSAPYLRTVERLRHLATGKSIVDSGAGRTGYVIYLDDGSWVLCYLKRDRLAWKTGRGALSWWQRRLMGSARHGDGHPPFSYDHPYASESCDMAAEVAKSRGGTINGLAIGADTFNFTFPDGNEIDASIVTDGDGRRALRVFWEQW